MNGQIKILLYIGFVFAILYFVQDKYSIFDISFNKPNENKEEKSEELITKSVEILNSDGQKIYTEIEIADTPELRKQGLSGRDVLGDYQGMLFIFDSEGEYSFWMKDMNFSLDLIYIDYRGYIVDIKKDVPPCTESECISFKPSKAFKYVLEVNGGFSDINRVEVGNAVIFNISSEE